MSTYYKHTLSPNFFVVDSPVAVGFVVVLPSAHKKKISRLGGLFFRNIGRTKEGGPGTGG